MRYMTLETLRNVIKVKQQRSTPEEFEQWKSTLRDRLKALDIVVLSDEPRWPWKKKDT